MKIIFVLVAFTISFFHHIKLYAQESKSNNTIDLLGSIGYTNLSNIKGSTTKTYLNSSSTGANLSFMGLYSLTNETSYRPLIGLSYNYIGTTTEKSLPATNNTQITSYYTSFSVAGHLGIKLFPTQKFNLIALANLGYGVSDYLEIGVKSNSSFIDSNLYSNNYKGKNHYYLGATVIGTYSFSGRWGLGGILRSNYHNLDLEYIAATQTNIENTSYDEFSVALVLNYSF